MITAYACASPGNEHHVLTPKPSASGLLVARTRDDALGGVDRWPMNLFELRVDPHDVMEQGAHVLRARRYEAVRMLPREEAFGRAATAIDAYIEGLRELGWLRASGADRGARIVSMVAEHYAALGHYGPVRAGTARVTHRIQDLEPIVDGSRRATSQLQFGARAKAGEAYVRELHRRVPAALRGAVGRGVVRIVFRMGLWPVFDDGVDTTVYVPAATDD
jgi:hypothetical protein